MEAWAAGAHRLLWHGPLWRIHASHHRPRSGRFEANDVFGVLHALLTIGVVAWGVLHRSVPVMAAGAGATAYGMSYLLLHDGFIHRRLPLEPWEGWGWLKAIREAHRQHHRTGRSPYGLLSGPWVLRRHGGRAP